VGKNKLKHFAENKTFPVLIQPTLEEVRNGFYLKGKWANTFFNNDHPVVLELGCGKGEYTVELARKFPLKNFIGVDFKGARLWRGSKTVTDDALMNAGFLRTRIEFIDRCFAAGEVSEIWITFPDPQPKHSKSRRRLTSPHFINLYRKILTEGGLVHLKTDDEMFYNYTLETILVQNLTLIEKSGDIYASKSPDVAVSVQTFYETKFLNQGHKIKYLCFRLNKMSNEKQER
jgi:tRNA (guanine-N7-)-methyltransferase